MVKTHQQLIAASVEQVRSAALEPIATGFAQPAEPVVVGDSIEWGSGPDLVDTVSRRARFVPADGGTNIEMSAEFEVRIPYFSWLLRPLIGSGVKTSLEHMAAVIEARAMNAQEPRARRPLWAPPSAMTRDQTAAIAAICAVLAITTYGGSLFAQAINYVGNAFDASDASLGVVSAITRVGTLAAIVGSVAADRRGRRQILIISTAGVSVVSIFSALSPSLAVFGFLQILSRGFVNLAAVVALIAVVEESPERSRAYTLAVSSVLGAIGYALGVILLPIADLGEEAWRVLFALAAVGLLLLPGLRRAVRETPRFVDLGDRILKSKATEVVDRLYGGRFAAVAATGFLMNFMAAPFSQFMNRFLQEERDFSAFDIFVLRAVTQGVPAVIAVWIGGRLAESHGRKPVATAGILATAAFTVVFFMSGGPILWLALLVSTFAGGLSGPALATFNTELFPTERRGTAGAGVLGMAVAGSAAGLMVAGFLSEPLGSIGASVALTAVGPLLVAVFLVRRLPEAMGLDLDRISPPEV
ncbi:MAG: MFS transporter [Actinobacteria bacterium]|nr:MFS transporter [Actinomycetota bacterium]